MPTEPGRGAAEYFSAPIHVKRIFQLPTSKPPSFFGEFISTVNSVSSHQRVGLLLFILLEDIPEMMERRNEPREKALILYDRSGAVVDPTRTLSSAGIRTGDFVYVRVVLADATGAAGALTLKNLIPYAMRSQYVARRMRFRYRRRLCWIGQRDEGSVLSHLPPPILDEVVQYFEYSEPSPWNP